LFLSKGMAGIRDGKPVFLYNFLDLKRTVWDGPELSPGKHTIVFKFKYDGPGFGKGGTGEQLLFDGGLTGAGTPMTRVAGIALIALGVACWPGPPLDGMLTYSAVVTLYLAAVGFAGGLTGMLLWPAVVLHVILGGCWRGRGSVHHPSGN